MGWTTGLLFLEGSVFLSLGHRVQTGSEAHPTSSAMGTKCSFPRG